MLLLNTNSSTLSLFPVDLEVSCYMLCPGIYSYGDDTFINVNVTTISKKFNYFAFFVRPHR